MVDLRLKLRDDEVETLLECIKTTATYYGAKSVTEITSGTQKGYMEAHEKKSYAWQLFDHIKNAVDSANERKEIAEEIAKDNKIELEIWGRKLPLKIEYDCYDGEELLPAQQTALKQFIENPSLIDGSLNAVKQYCLELDGSEIADGKIENIFKYVVPQSIFVKRPSNVEEPSIGLMCAYRFNEDDGIAIVFTAGKFIEVGTQNSLL